MWCRTKPFRFEGRDSRPFPRVPLISERAARLAISPILNALLHVS